MGGGETTTWSCRIHAIYNNFGGGWGLSEPVATLTMGKEYDDVLSEVSWCALECLPPLIRA